MLLVRGIRFVGSSGPGRTFSTKQKEKPAHFAVPVVQSRPRVWKRLRHVGHVSYADCKRRRYDHHDEDYVLVQNRTGGTPTSQPTNQPTKQNKTKQNKTKHNKPKQNKTKQTKPNQTKPNQTKQPNNQTTKQPNNQTQPTNKQPNNQTNRNKQKQVKNKQQQTTTTVSVAFLVICFYTSTLRTPRTTRETQRNTIRDATRHDNQHVPDTTRTPHTANITTPPPTQRRNLPPRPTVIVVKLWGGSTSPQRTQTNRLNLPTVVSLLASSANWGFGGTCTG